MSQLQPSESAPSVRSDGSINHDEKPHTRLLLSLPVELMVMTAQHLSKSDLCSFRISCKGVEDKTFRHFAAKYFSEKCFMPSSYGLRGLVAMSRSRLAPYIQTLGLGPATNEIVADGENIMPKFPLVMDQPERMEDVVMIRDALRNLPHVKSLNFLDAPEYSEGSTSYGWHHELHKIGLSMFPLVEKKWEVAQYMYRIFSATLDAAQAAGLHIECIDIRSTRLNRALEIISRSNGYYGTSLCLFDPRLVFVAPQASTLAHLSTLKVCIADYRDHGTFRHFGGTVSRLKYFLAQIPRLDTFGITMTSTHLWAARFLKEISDVLVEKGLKKLEISGICMSPSSFIKIIEPYRSNLLGFKASHLRIVGFEGESWYEDAEWAGANMECLKDIELGLDSLGQTPVSYHGGPGAPMEMFLKSTFASWDEWVLR